MLSFLVMPNIRAAAKRMRADRKRRLRNLAVRSELRSLTKRFHLSLQKKEGPQAKTAYLTLVKRWDQAASKGIVRRNTASRRKSRLARQLASFKSS